MRKLNQNKTAALILTTGWMLSAVTVLAQPPRISIKVNSTVGIQQEQPFEVLPQPKSDNETGSTAKQTRTVNSLGAYTLKGKENSNVLIQLNAPQSLTNSENQKMPFTMSLAWNNTATDAGKLRFNDSKSSVFTFGNAATTPGTKIAQDDDRVGYLYLKGTAEVPANAQSPFAGEVKLTIEY